MFDRLVGALCVVWYSHSKILCRILIMSLMSILKIYSNSKIASFLFLELCTYFKEMGTLGSKQ